MSAALFSSTGEMSHLHRLITRITLVGSVASAAIIAMMGTATNDSTIMWEAVGPGLTALLILPMVLRGRENAALALALATSAVVITFKLVGSANNTVAATTAVVIMASLSVLFLTKHVVPYISTGMAAMIAISAVWAERLDEALPAGLVMSLSFLVASVAFILVRNAAGEVNNRYRLTFKDAPVALLEVDWTDAIAQLDALGISNVERAIGADHSLLADLVERTRIVRANSEAAVLFQVSDPSELVGAPDGRYAAGSLAGWWTSQLATVRDGGPTTDHELSLAEFGIERWICVRTINGRRPAGVATSILALTDVTATRLHEKSLTELIEAKDEFIATVSHELRTPLTAVVGLTSELATSNSLDREEQSELLRIVFRQASEISFIVEDLLVAARADIGTVSVVSKPLDLVGAVQDVLTALSNGLAIRSDGEPPTVVGDPVRIGQIVRNLIVNAERYGGPECHLRVRTFGSTACLEVRDSGEPIPVESRQRIFERYERANDRANDRASMTMAMGLGLSVSRRLARLMDGELDYNYDGESVFRLTLPLAAAYEGASTELPLTTPSR